MDILNEEGIKIFLKIELYVIPVKRIDIAWRRFVNAPRQTLLAPFNHGKPQNDF